MKPVPPHTKKKKISEIINTHKGQERLHSCKIGKIFQKHHAEIVVINKSGEQLIVNCKSYLVANRLVTSPNL